MSEFRCPLCDKTFAKTNSLSKHKSRSHREKPPEKFSCFYCDYKTVYKYNLNKHMNKIHFSEDGTLIEQKASSQPLKVCCLCNNFKCTERSKMIDHYIDNHNIPINEEVLFFNSFDDFVRWKRETESQEYCRFVAASSTRKRLTKHVWFFRCFRDGHYMPKGKGKRSLKVKGSVKMGSVCPCSMKVTKTLETGAVSVWYVRPHVGHNPDVSRLTLTKQERDYIASEISAGVPDDELLSSLRDSMSCTELRRLHLTTRKDLWNIKNSARSQKTSEACEQLLTAEHCRKPLQEAEQSEMDEHPETGEQIVADEQIQEDEQIEVEEQPEVAERTKYEDMKQALINNFSILIESTHNCAQLELIRKVFSPLPDAIKSLEADMSSCTSSNVSFNSSTNLSPKNLKSCDENMKTLENSDQPEISVQYEDSTGCVLSEIISQPLYAEDVHVNDKVNDFQVFY